MADLRIVDAPVLLQESITDDVKMPTGGLGNFSIRLGDIVWYVVTKEQLANKNYVDTSSKGVKDSLDEHIADKANPHQVTKAQVGLGNVDNTADVDKPISNATKAYVNSKDGDLTTLKTADKTNLVKAVNEIHDVTKGVVALYDKNVEAGAGANGWTDTLIAVSENINQRQINDGLESIAQLAGIQNPRDGMRVVVKSYHTPNHALINPYCGGGTFVYDATKANINDGALTINGWVRLVSNNEINVLWCGAIGDGVADDTNAFNKAKNLACKIGGGVYVPQPVKEYILSSSINIDEKVYFRGDLGTMIDTWRGKTSQGGSRIKYTGNGVAFQINPLFAPTSEQRPPYGCLFKDLVIEGTENATYGIKVSDKANIGVSGADIGSFNIDNVYLLNFKKGYGLQINYCFMNTITNLFTGDCAVAVSLNYAHNTTFIGGSIQQNLFGLDIINSYDVTFHGTCLQGNTVDRAALGLEMPSDFYVWTDGWNGQGANGITRTQPQHYAGIGCRVFGSIVNWFGGYEEYNTVGYITELGSSLGLHGKYVDLDAKTNYWVQIGIGALSITSPTFAQGDKPNLKGVIHTERNHAAPLNVISPIVPSTLPQNKLYTGRTAGNAGVYDAWNPNTFKFERNYLSSNINLNGQLTHKGLVATSGFNREFRETVLPASDTNKTLDLAVGTTGLNFAHLANGVTLTLDFNDANRAQAGSTMRVVVINNHATADTIVTNSSNFRMGAPNYTITAQKQRVFEFYFENGVWLEKGVAVSL